MGKFVLRDCVISTDDVDVSNHCKSVTVESKFDEVDVTGFGSIYKEIAQGLGDATITLEVFTDTEAASIDDTLWPLSQSGEPFEIKVRATSDAISSTNPEYRMTGVLLQFNPIAGSVGDASSTSVPIRNSSPVGLTRHVS